MTDSHEITINTLFRTEKSKTIGTSPYRPYRGVALGLFSSMQCIIIELYNCYTILFMISVITKVKASVISRGQTENLYEIVYPSWL